MSEKVNLGEFTDNKAITLKEIIDKAKAIYESSVGYEYRYIGNKEEKLWLQDKIEKNLSTQQSDKKWILQQLVAAEGLEKYLALRYVGQKRFGLEGGESLIPSLQHVIEKAVSRHSTRFIQLGMAHRGRLNVLVNVMGKILRIYLKNLKVREAKRACLVTSNTIWDIQIIDVLMVKKQKSH